MSKSNMPSPLDNISPVNPKHPFWSANTGSQLKLRLQKPPSSAVSSMILTVHTISEPYTYEIYVLMENGTHENIVYKKKKEAIKMVKDTWLNYYPDRTNVEFIEHETIDISKLDNRLNLNTDGSSSVSPRSPLVSPGRNNRIFVDSCPPTPSPRSMRKSSLKTMLKTIALSYQNKKSPRDSNSSSCSSSKEPSPRSVESSPRRRWTQLKMSGSDRKNATTDGSNNTDISIGLSPRTTRLLKRASVKLALRASQKSVECTSPSTPRNSSSGIKA